MNKSMSRREALRWLTLTAAASLVACQPTNQAQNQPQSNAQPAEPVDNQPVNTPQTNTPSADQAYLSVVHGQDPAAITEAAVRALGGMERFVQNGFNVIIKPNICTDYYSYEYGATTNPIVVATLVSLALGAGAGRVRVMDYPFGGSAESAYVVSGIADAVQAAGGEMEVMNPAKFRSTQIPDGVSISNWDIYQDVLDCDLFINVPIAKQHGLATMTAGCKNMLGVIENRSAIHAQMGERIPDLVSLLRPELTVVDAIRTLMQNGPTGGSLDDVQINNTVIASHDVVTCDAYATRFLGLTPADIPYIVHAAERGLGVMDLNSVRIDETSL
ncbi:MAG TPA: DUF362 domain-containing protein [Longilinea sp.]|nr:DUF362 domain-containing protein [Longilinea sp.]